MNQLRKTLIVILAGGAFIFLLWYTWHSFGIIPPIWRPVPEPTNIIVAQPGISKAENYFINSATGGDGYLPVVYGMPNGETWIFALYHHNPKFIGFNDAPNINCVIAIANKRCPGYPKFFSSVAGDPGTSQPSDANTIATSMAPHYVTVGSRIYYTAHRLNDNGVGFFYLYKINNF